MESLESRCLLATIGGEVFIDLDADGQKGPTEVGASGIRVFIDTNDNGLLDSGEQSDQTDSLGNYVITGIPQGDHPVRVEAPRGQIQTSPTAYFGTGVTNPLQSDTQLFEMTLAGEVRQIGTPTVDPIQGLVRTNDGAIFGVNIFNGSVYSIDPTTGQETLLSQSNLQLDAGLAYDPGADKIYALALEPGTADTSRLYEVDPTTGDLGPAIGPGLTGLTAVSDFTFDTVNNRIIGFDNDDDEFFEFQTDGTAQSLSTASRPLDSFSLAFNGTSFVMFDNGDVNGTLTVEVNPDTGEVIDGFNATTAMITESLFHAKKGDIAQRLTLNANDVVVDVDFGLALLDTVSQRVDDHPTVINEILVDGSFADFDPSVDQYLEFRGEPGGTLNPNTYFVIVDEDNSPGEIQGIFDLSDQQLGANGFLVLLQQNSIFQPDPASAVLQSITAGFSALPGGIYTSTQTTNEQLDDFRAHSYFLVESAIAPQLNDDIDTDDDGFADPGGVKDNWTVLDSLSMHPDVFFSDQAYAQILFAEDDFVSNPVTRTVEPGTPVVVGGGFGYVARVGDSVGSSADDWIFGTVHAAERDTSLRTTLFELDGDFFSSVVPRVYQGRDLDHVGDSNFVGGVRGTIELAPGLGETDPFGNPLPIQPGSGLTVLADLNGNGVQDTLEYVVDPDFAVDFNNLFDVNGNEIDFPLTNEFPGVTVTAVDDLLDPDGLEIVTSRETINFFTPTQNFLFSAGFFSDTFSTFRRLRFDFYRPVSEVSIQALGSEFGLTPSTGTLEAYDINDQLVDTVQSGLLINQSRETITVSSPNEDIAYVVAYSQDLFGGRFDRMSYMQSEPSAVTDANGQFEIKGLFPALYDVAVLENEASEGLIGGVPQRISVTRYENFLFNDTLRPNVGPVIEPEIQFTIDENLPEGTSIGILTASDLDRQQLQFDILDGAESGLLLDPATGELTVGPDAELDFEETPEIVLTIGVTDGLLTAESVVTLTLNDLNEAPVVEEAVFFVAEDTANNTSIGQVEAFDPDFQQAQVLTFSITGGSGIGIITVNESNGLLTLVDADAINFETLSELNLDIRISDNADPPLFTDIVQRIRVLDQNDLPVITSTQFSVPENSTGVVGVLQVDDPDEGQTHTFDLLGGTGVDLFDVTRTGDIFVRDGVTIDFEQGDTYTLQVITIDSGAPPLAVDETVTLTITDVNEPPLLDQTSVPLAENSPGGTSVTTLAVVDPENSGSAYTIALLEQGDAANFDFDPATNLLTVADGADLDFEAKPVHALLFEITDPTGTDPPSQVPLLIELTDQNDPPIVVTPEVVLSELAQPGTVVGRVEVQIREPDRGDQVTVQIVGGNAASLFDLDPDTRILTVAAGAQFDADGDPDPLAIDVEVADAGGLSSVGTIDVILNDVNEPPVIVDPPASPTVVSGEAFELVIAEDAIVDPEGRSFSLAIFDDSGVLPDWLEFDETTRTLSGLPTPLLVGSYPLMLRAFEPGPLPLFSEVAFTVVVEIGDTPLSNQRNPLDVDANGQVASLDALRVINFIDRHGSGTSVGEQNPFTGFVDVSLNGIVTALDALLVINGLEQAIVPFGEQISFDDSDEHREAVDEALANWLSETSLF